MYIIVKMYSLLYEMPLNPKGKNFWRQSFFTFNALSMPSNNNSVGMTFYEVISVSDVVEFPGEIILS